MNFSALQLDKLLDIAYQAGLILKKYFNDYQFDVTIKADDSPVTAADLAANKYLVAELSKLCPEIAIISEENTEEQNKQAASQGRFFIIDPLDGTSAFIKKSDEFTVNIAHAAEGIVTFGIIYLPIKDIMYFTDLSGKTQKIVNYSKDSKKAQQISVSANQDNLAIICTKRDPEKSEIMSELRQRNISIKELISIASSYKFCLMAEGAADFYPRRARIKAWDIAAGHALVKSAGGNVLDLSGQEITYDLQDSFSVPFFDVVNYKI